MRLPGHAGRRCVAAGAATWIGALVGLPIGGAAVPAAAAVAVAVAIARRRGLAVLAAMLCAGAVSGWVAAERTEATWSATVPEGSIVVVGVVAEDGGSDRPAVLHPEALAGGELPWRGPALAVALSGGLRLVAGDRVVVEGVARARAGTVRGDPVAGWITAEAVKRLGPGRGPLFDLGNAVRRRVMSVIPAPPPEGALLTGFLIGDTSGLPATDVEALRRSGLTHYVAVSGSNVALFLAGWWLLTAPFGMGARRRFAIGLLGLVVFVVATRWEASVIRAATMAGLVLGGAATGYVVDGWMALGSAVCVVLLVSGRLAVDVGFQLSVAATAGILIGAGIGGPRRPRWLWTALAAAVSAQVAVVPILLLHFGRVPLLSPVANLIAAPLVSGATVVGVAAAVTGWSPLVEAATTLASLVLGVARLAAAWPQLGLLGVLAGLGGAGIALVPRWRPVATVAAALVLAVVTIAPLLGGAGTSLTALDIGQGDAVLLRSEGRVVLVDGGANPALLADRLRSHRVGRIDLLVASHGDIDHVGGFEGILSIHGVGRLWVPGFAELGPALDSLVAEATEAGVVVEYVDARSPALRIGSMRIEPIAPLRRYRGDNDGSIVLWVESERTVLLAGDIEAVAQRELPGLAPDIMVVPHHGSASSDADWLRRTVGSIAIVSVGPNRFGHPSPEVIGVLEDAGAAVLETRHLGDVTVDF